MKDWESYVTSEILCISGVMGSRNSRTLLEGPKASSVGRSGSNSRKCSRYDGER